MATGACAPAGVCRKHESGLCNWVAEVRANPVKMIIAGDNLSAGVARECMTMRASHLVALSKHEKVSELGVMDTE